MSSPLRAMLPSRTLTWPKIALRRVDLLAPLGPMMPISSPCSATRLRAVEDVDAWQVSGDQVLDLHDGGHFCSSWSSLIAASSFSTSAMSSCASAPSSPSMRPVTTPRSTSWWAPR